MSRNVIKPQDENESIIKEQRYSGANAVRSTLEHSTKKDIIQSQDYSSSVAAENRYLQHGGDGQDRSIEEQRRANEALDSIKFDGDIDLDREKNREQLGYRDYQYDAGQPAQPERARPTYQYQAERYREADVEQPIHRAARYGEVERETHSDDNIGGVAGAAVIRGAESSVIHSDVTGVAGAAAVKDSIEEVARESIVNPTDTEVFSSTLQQRETPAYQAVRYQQTDIEKAITPKEARYGFVEKPVGETTIIGGAAGAATVLGSNSSVIKADTTGASGAAAIKAGIGETAKDSVRQTDAASFAEQVDAKKVSSQGFIKTVGGIAVRETVAAVASGGDDLSGKVQGQTAKYGYKAGKYAAVAGVAVTKGTYGLAKEALNQRKGVVESNYNPLKKAAANKVVKDKATTGIKGSGSSIKKIIKNEVVKGIEDFHGSDDLGIQALTAPKDVYVKTKRTIATVKATGGAVQTAARGTKKAAETVAHGIRKVAQSIKSFFSSAVIARAGVGFMAILPVLLIVLVIVAIMNTIIPTIALKSNDKELTRTYEYVTELDANLTDDIRQIPNGSQGWGINEFHFYVNGFATTADQITIYTNADYLLMFLDTKYDDYAFNKLIYGIFGGTNVKDEVKAIHDRLYSYSTFKWKEEIEHSSSYTDEDGNTVDDSWTEIIWHLDINVYAQSFEQYLTDNIDTLFTHDEQERFDVISQVGAYTAHVELGNPFADEDYYYISSRWGWRIHPITGAVVKHTGIDIPKEAGTPINNVMVGSVSYVGYDASGYGNYCTVTSANGEKEVLYAHMQSVAVSQGQLVNKGDIIGYVGSTGSSTGAHLHLEYSIDNGFNTNPAFFLDGASYTGVGSNDIVAVAISQIGNDGGQPYWSWYGFGSRVEWCACFVSWCANECGYIDSGVVPKYCGCISGRAWFISSGLWKTGGGSYIPIAGDIIFFDWQNDGVVDHTGIVESCDGATVYTIEGNTGSGLGHCARKSYSLYSSVINGYGTPAYPAR